VRLKQIEYLLFQTFDKSLFLKSTHRLEELPLETAHELSSQIVVHLEVRCQEPVNFHFGLQGFLTELARSLITVALVQTKHQFVRDLVQVRSVGSERLVAVFYEAILLNVDDFIEHLSALLSIRSAIKDAEDHQRWNVDEPLIQTIIVIRPSTFNPIILF